MLNWDRDIEEKCMETIAHFTEINTEPVYTKLNKELTRANATIDKFVYSLSHEFSGPLKSVKGLVKLLERSMKSPDEQDYLSHIDLTISNLELLLEELGKDVEGKFDIPYTAMNISAELENVLAEFHLPLKNKNIRTLIESDQVIPFYNHPDRFKMIFRNLIHNIVTFSDNEKTDRFAFFGIEVTPEMCSITLVDNGMGIDPSMIEKVFNPFFKGSEKSSGMGIGLYLTKKVLRKMGGDIQVDSVQGKGTSFTIECPNFNL